jgi:hypothetical protein
MMMSISDAPSSPPASNPMGGRMFSQSVTTAFRSVGHAINFSRRRRAASQPSVVSSGLGLFRETTIIRRFFALRKAT